MALLGLLGKALEPAYTCMHNDKERGLLAVRLGVILLSEMEGVQNRSGQERSLYGSWHREHTHTDTHTYIYVYIYVCV